MTISKELLDEPLSGVENADDLLSAQGLMKELKVRLMERMLGAELAEHLGYEPDGQRWTRKFGPFVKADRLMRETIQNDEETKEPFAGFQSACCA